MKTDNSRVDTALFIALLTGFIYGVAYIFEFSYQSYYQVPLEFIDLNINNITKSILLTIAIIAVVYVISDILSTLITKTKASIFDMPPVALLAFCGIIVFCAMFMGNFWASQKEVYLTIKQNKQLFVVVTPYKDNLIIAPIDIETRTMTPKLKVVEVKSMSNAEIIEIDGGLKIKELRNSEELKEEQKK